MFNGRIVPESALPNRVPHVTVTVVGPDSETSTTSSSDLVTLDELIADSR